MRYTVRLSLSCLIFVWAAGPASAGGKEPGPADARAMLAEMNELFAGLGSRAPGMPGNAALEARVVQLFKSSGFPSGAMHFLAPVFVPGEASIALAGEKAVPIQTMHPTLMRPGNFAEPEFKTRLVYLGLGRYDDLERAKGTDLKGSVALMEFDCGDRWLQLLRFGIKGFIFIGRDRYDYVDSYTKIYNTEAAVPRFFVTADDGARLKAACARSDRSTPAPDAVVRSAPSRWKIKTLRSPWVIVPGDDPDLAKEVIVFTAPLDANSVVPERAVGAQSAGNLYLLLKLLEAFQAERPRRSVMLVAVNAHTHNFLGERLLAWHLLGATKGVEDVRYVIAQEMRVMRLYTEMYGLLKLKPIDIDESELHVWMEVLWQLDAKQQALRDAEPEKAEEKKGPTKPATELPDIDEEELYALYKPEIEPVLDLSPFTERDYHEAIDAVAEKLEGQRTGFVAWLMTGLGFRDDATLAALLQDVERTERLKTLSFAEMKQWAARVKPVFDDEKLLESWRVKLDGSTGKRLPVKDKLQNEAKRNLNRLKMKMMAISRNKEIDPDERKQLLEELHAKRPHMTKVLVLFNKIDIGIGRDRVYYRQIATNELQRELLKGYRDGLFKDFTARRKAMRRALGMDSSNDCVRGALGERRVSLVISLDVNWNSDRLGLCSVSPYVGNDWQSKFGKAAAEIAKKLDEKEDRKKSPFVDAMTRPGGRQEPYFFHSTVSPAPCFHAAEVTPAISVRSVFTNHGMAFSPEDTFDRLDAGRVFRLHTWLRRYFQAVLADETITDSKTLLKPRIGDVLWSIMLRTFTLDQFAGKTTPDRAIPGCLIALYSTESKTVLPFLVDGDVVNCYRVMADETGSTVLYAVREKETLAPIAYQMDKDFRTVLYDIDKGRVQESKQLNSNVHRQATRTFPMFPCFEFPVYDRMDPTLISDMPITVQQYWPMSAAMKAAPQKYGTHGLACLSTAKSHVSKGPASVSIWRKDKEFRPERLLLLTKWKRCALYATGEKPEGKGFGSEEELGQDFFAWVARDMDTMNRKRLKEMKGVSNELVTDFLARGAQALAEMAERETEHDHNGFLLANYRAVGTEVKAYDQIRALNTDMLQAVVLYMALMVPFCFFLQKLLFNFTRLELNMLAFVLMFTGTYVVFRLIHPAFRIAVNPEAIFIAFILGAVGCFVTWVLHKRFETEMQLLFRNVTGMEADVAYATVGQAAMIIGVNNMKRRRIRTSLTTATIVLVVFTMLAFSSVSKKMQPTLVNKADESPYTGLFYHWPAGQPVDEETAAALKNIFGNRAEMLVRRVLYPAQPMLLEKTSGPENPINIETIVGLPLEEDGFLDRLPLTEGRNFSSPLAREIILSRRAFEASKIPRDQVGRAKLRLLGEELTLVGVMEDERYRFMRDLNPDLPLLPRARKPTAEQKMALEGGDISAQTVDMAGVAFLPSELAAKLGADPFTISIRFPESAHEREPWEEVSIFLAVSRAKFYVSALAADMAGVAFLPSELAARLGAAPFATSIRSPEGEDGETQTDLWKVASLFPAISGTNFYVSALTVDVAGMAFLPSEPAAKLGAALLTLSIHLPEDEERKAQTKLWKEVSLFLDVSRAKFFVGSKRPFKPDEEARQVIRPGIYYIGSSYRTSIGGLSRLFIPLLIAGSIILNTMLGTVYERKYEIAVYNAIGLNPTHIFLFFLAEAFVYGVIGAVGGYLIGQVLAMILKGLEVVEGININFSSLMVGYAILFTIGLVLLSTIYPGIVATRTAVPSGKRKWSLPEHDGHRMHVVFPFIYQPNLAPGVMYYLYEYFLTFTEQSIGEQIATLEEVRASADEQGRTTYHLKYEIALAPFDLGVTQSALFATHYDDIVDSYRVRMTITRVSGQDTNWVTTNKPFLEKLRKLLIRWRNIDPTQHNWYVEQGKQLFEDAEKGQEAAATAKFDLRT